MKASFYWRVGNFYTRSKTEAVAAAAATGNPGIERVKVYQ